MEPSKTTSRLSAKSFRWSGCQAGDDSLLKSWFGATTQRIRIAQHITQNREDAEDVVQEAFLKATATCAVSGTVEIYTWLVRIAVNEALMKLRKRNPSAPFAG